MTNIISQSFKNQIFKNLRLFHISASQNGQAKVMKKVMGGSSKKKFKYREAPPLPTPTMFSKGAFEGKQSPNSKRAAVLNKLFMRYITDLMATGECSSEFIGHGIEVNQVKITPDFSCVQVYWIARGTEQDDIVEDILQKNTGSLRHELAQLKVVGVIPKIKFVKDKQHAQAVEVDRLLSRADFGEDYIPLDLTSKLKTQLELNTSLKPEVVKQIQKLDSEVDIQEIEEVLPPMPQNIFGLNHSEMMERIHKYKTKSQAVHRLHPQEESPPHTINENPIQFSSANEERQAFREFLRKRQVLKNKANKEDKNYKPELELMQEEWQQEQKRLYSSYNFEQASEDKDFIEDVDNAK